LSKNSQGVLNIRVKARPNGRSVHSFRVSIRQKIRPPYFIDVTLIEPQVSSGLITLTQKHFGRQQIIKLSRKRTLDGAGRSRYRPRHIRNVGLEYSPLFGTTGTIQQFACIVLTRRLEKLRSLHNEKTKLFTLNTLIGAPERIEPTD
jgi:hypothetical protein